MMKIQPITNTLLEKYLFHVNIPTGWSFQYDDAKFSITDDLFDAMTLGVCEILAGAYTFGGEKVVNMLNGTDTVEIPETEIIRGGYMTTTIDVKHKNISLNGYLSTGTFKENNRKLKKISINF